MPQKSQKNLPTNKIKPDKSLKRLTGQKKISLNPRRLTRMEEETAKLINRSLREKTEEIEQGIDFETVSENKIYETSISTTYQEKEEEEGQLSVDIYQTDNDINIFAAIAGMKKENLKVTVTNDVLHIKGKREKPYNFPQNECITHECFWGIFSRAIVLPEDIDKNNIKAEFKEGVLKIRIPKSEKVRTKIITIK